MTERKEGYQCPHLETIAQMKQRLDHHNGNYDSIEQKIDKINTEVSSIKGTLDRMEGSEEAEHRIKKFSLLKKEIWQDRIALIIAGLMVAMTLLNIFSPFVASVLM